MRLKAFRLESWNPVPLQREGIPSKGQELDLATLLTIKNVLDEDGSESTETYPFQFLDGYKADFTQRNAEPYQ